MKLAFIVFDGITLLDFIGVYDPITRLKSMGYLPLLSWDICSFSDTVFDSFGLEIKPSKIKTSLEHYDAIIVPGGLGTRRWMNNNDFLNWMRTAEKVNFKISVCTGSLLLGAAGFLTNKKATTNSREYGLLANYCKEVLNRRIVEDGDVITARAVTASIDLGLYLCKKWSGIVAAQEIRRRMEYSG